MPVTYGPYHLIGHDHLDRLTVYLNGLVLTSKQSGLVWSCDANTNDYVAANLTLQDASLPPATDTPLDTFFKSFPAFAYDPVLPPAKSFKKLSKHMNWRKDTDDSRHYWRQYQEALLEEFELWFGAEDDLQAWHALCRAVGVVPLPTTYAACAKVGANITYGPFLAAADMYRI